MEKVAVLLAAYNGEKWIDEQINSILSQNNVCVKIFISCDLSTDSTMKILNDYNDNRIVILPYGEKFGAAAPNFYRLINDVPFEGFDFIALSDQDDIWLPDKLSAGIKFIKEKKAVAYSSNVTAFWEDGKEKEIIKATPQKKYDFLFEGPGPGCSFVLTNTFAVEFQKYIKDKQEDLRKLDWHDWVLYAFARSKNYKWVIDNESHMLYRQHSNNQLGANSGIKQFKKRIKEIKSGYGITQTALIIKFLNMENEKFIEQWFHKGRKGYLYLFAQSKNCRRRRKDQTLFRFSCILMFCRNIKIGN